MRPYRPRRASARWLDGDCPPGVLAIFDHPHEHERYTIFYAQVDHDAHGDPWIGYLGSAVDPQGCSGHGQMEAWKVRQYRYRNHHRCATWSSLPDAVKDIVRRDLAPAAPSPTDTRP